MTLTCVSNEVGGILAGTARWLGVPLRELLDEAGQQARPTRSSAARSTATPAASPIAVLEDDRTALVAVGMNGEPLPVEHGFPARLLVAGLYGYVSATKWLTEIELTSFDRFDQYWVPRGLRVEGARSRPSPASTRPKALDATRPPAPSPSPASPGRRPVGIDKVEVKIDDGPWQDIRNCRPLRTRRRGASGCSPWSFASRPPHHHLPGHRRHR